MTTSKSGDQREGGKCILARSNDGEISINGSNRTITHLETQCVESKSKQKVLTSSEPTMQTLAKTSKSQSLKQLKYNDKTQTMATNIKTSVGTDLPITPECHSRNSGTLMSKFNVPRKMHMDEKLDKKYAANRPRLVDYENTRAM